MLEIERVQLETRESDYLSVGITTDGLRVARLSIPWEKTVTAFNMKRPSVFLSPEDLEDAEVMKRIKERHVIGCYIFTKLNDYSFIADFSDLYDLYIREGVNVKDLSFLSKLAELKMFHIEHAHLNNLDAIYQSSLNQGYRAFCLSFDRCQIDDISSLNKLQAISELIVVGERKDDERNRWKSIPAWTFRYYPFEE